MDAQTARSAEESDTRPSSRSGRSFYASSVREFLTADPEAIIGRLSSRHVAFHAAAEATQIRAWTREIELLTIALSSLGPEVSEWWLLLEVPLLRLGRRLDAVLLAPGVVCVIEFKIGANAVASTDRIQTERYAQSLRDFHEASQKRVVVPILCVEAAQTQRPALRIVDAVASLIEVNASSLVDSLLLLAEIIDPNSDPLDGPSFDASPYRPTPTIVEAAQSLYAGHEIGDIGRGDAADAALRDAASALQLFAAEAEREQKKIICFITGTPGAGKTLLGLDLALKSRSGTRPAALLSGNRPLVHVLTEALAADSSSRGRMTIATARYQAGAAIQNLLGYLKEHTDGPPPPENVIVFDEAQRAWNADVGKDLMGRPSSEPELFLEILDRLDWSCLVCLVGPGQEINRGEEGLALWGEALVKASHSGRSWEVVAAPQALDGGPDIPGAGLFVNSEGVSIMIRRCPALHLANAIRAYRNPLHTQWVDLLLLGQIPEARRLVDRMEGPPTHLTRDLEAAKDWLRNRRRGKRTVGLLVSSGAVRLVGDGVPPAPRSNQLGPIGHWFLKPHTDFRSAGALETPISEFGCQGLEIDYAGLCWGGDLLWDGESWTPRMMRSPRWQIARDEGKRRFRLNGYRVLLTRARAGVVIYVPKGSEDDPTRDPSELDSVAKALIASGCATL